MQNYSLHFPELSCTGYGQDFATLFALIEKILVVTVRHGRSIFRRETSFFI